MYICNVLIVFLFDLKSLNEFYFKIHKLIFFSIVLTIYKLRDKKCLTFGNNIQEGLGAVSYSELNILIPYVYICSVTLDYSSCLTISYICVQIMFS